MNLSVYLNIIQPPNVWMRRGGIYEREERRFKETSGNIEKVPGTGRAQQKKSFRSIWELWYRKPTMRSGCMRMSDSKPWTRMTKNILWCVSYENL